MSANRGQWREPGGDGDDARDKLYRGLDLKGLVRLMRQDDFRALREFVRRHEPILRGYCDSAGWPVADFVTLAGDVLDDVAMHVMKAKGLIPENVDNLVITVFKNRFIDEEREATRQAGTEALEVEHYADDVKVHRGACSENSLQTAAGASSEPVPLPVGVRRLASMLEEGLSEEERHIIAWVSARIRQSEIAEWLGSSHAATRKRLERLRVRLGELAETYRRSLSGSERREVDRFFRRFDAVIGDRRPPSTGGTGTVGNE